MKKLWARITTPKITDGDEQQTQATAENRPTTAEGVQEEQESDTTRNPVCERVEVNVAEVVQRHQEAQATVDPQMSHLIDEGLEQSGD